MTRLRSIELALPGAGAAAHFLTDHWGMAPATRDADTWHLRGAGDDAYLLALAATHGGRFATFYQRVGVEVVPAASRANLCVSACD
jgi:hypothetical protein